MPIWSAPFVDACANNDLHVCPQEKGVDTVACVAVNDAFVLDAWGKSVGADGKVLLLADGSALFTKVR